MASRMVLSETERITLCTVTGDVRI